MIEQLLVAFSLGLIGSTHCIGMCGPIALLLETESSHAYRDSLIYNLGRVVTYCFLGFITGLFGLTLQLSGLQSIVSILSGLLLLIFLLIPRLWRHFETRIYSIHFIKNLKQNILLLNQNQKNRNTGFFIGIVNGLLPCGMVYIAITAALQIHSVIGSVIFMAFFGFGTIPLMLVNSILTPKLIHKFRQLNQLKLVLTVCLAVLFILRGLNLGIPYVSPKPLQNNLPIELHH